MSNVEKLTELVRTEAQRLGANLVGIAPVSRWAKAPIEHSPQGVFPGAKSVIVCGVHFLDAVTELGHKCDVRQPGPALAELSASVLLSTVGFGLSRFVQKQGQNALFVPQSGLWRYRSENGDRGWVGDICHYYAAVCAGLGEVGWANITLSPEYGPRQRWISIITDAELTPTPMYDGEPLCDRCNLCAKNCPTDSFVKDVSGRMLSIEVEDKKYEFPERNLWRCAIGENFQLDVLLDEWKDREITEDVIVEMEEEALRNRREWVTGWKMGMCLKHCLPPKLRYFDRDYSHSPRRRRAVTPDTSEANLARVVDDLLAHARLWDVDQVGTASAETMRAAGVDLTEFMPDAESVVVIGIEYPEHCRPATGYDSGLNANSQNKAQTTELRLGFRLQEVFGFSALPMSGISDERAAEICGLTVNTGSVIWRTLLTSAPLKDAQHRTTSIELPRESTPAALAERVRQTADADGLELVGFAPAERIANAAEGLDRIFAEEGKDYFVVEDQGWGISRKTLWGGQAWPFNPEARPVELKTKKPADYLPGAKSVIVIGVRLLDASIDSVGKPGAHKAAHFHTSVHGRSHTALRDTATKIARLLNAAGHRVAPAQDLCGLASQVVDGGDDLTASRFAAVAAGLGEIGSNGLVLTPEFGPRQRFFCLVTDAELPCDDVYSGPALCTNCKECVSACPMTALEGDEKHTLEIGGQTFSWSKRDRLRCDWCQRYGLIPEAGGMYIGCRNNVQAPDQITPECVVEAFRDGDRVQRPSYNVTVERCFTSCPAGSPEDAKA